MTETHIGVGFDYSDFKEQGGSVWAELRRVMIGAEWREIGRVSNLLAGGGWRSVLSLPLGLHWMGGDEQ